MGRSFNLLHLMSSTTTTQFHLRGNLPQDTYLILFAILSSICFLNPFLKLSNSLVIVPRTILALYILCFLPGRVLIDNLQLKLEDSRLLLYSVGISLSLIMFFGYIIHLFRSNIFTSVKPVSSSTLLIYSLLVCGFWYYYSGDVISRDLLRVKNYHFSRFCLLGGVAVVIAFSASLAINRGSEPVLALLYGLFLSLLVVLLVSGVIPRQDRSLLIYLLSYSLLIQNLVRTPYLSRSGDTGFEYYFAHLSLAHGFWNSSFGSTKITSLYIGSFYPFLKIFTGVSLLDVFIYFYPLLLALVSVSLYKAYSRQFNSTIGIVGALLFTFADLFFTLLSRSTRTGAALFYLSLILLVVLSKNTNLSSGSRMRHLLLLFLSTLVFVHYGTAIIMVVLLFSSYFYAYILSFARPQTILYKGLIRQSIIYCLVLIVWYIYIAKERTFQLMVMTIYLVLRQIVRLKLSGSNSVAVATKNFSSLTSQLIRAEYFLIMLTAGLCVSLFCYQLFKHRIWEGQDHASSLSISNFELGTSRGWLYPASYFTSSYINISGQSYLHDSRCVYNGLYFLYY